MQSGKIDIGTILNKFDDTYDERSNEVKTYGIKYLKRKDGNGNVLGSMVSCRKNVKNPKARLKGGNNERGKFRFNLKESGTILLHDESTGNTRSVKVSCIYAFRDHNGQRWLTRG